MFGEVGANLNGQYNYPEQFSRLICRWRKRNKAGVLHLVFAIVVPKSIFGAIIYSSLQFELSGIVFGEVRANHNKDVTFIFWIFLIGDFVYERKIKIAQFYVLHLLKSAYTTISFE